jgi:hypothetical protein
MFVVERPFERFFYILGIQKTIWTVVELLFYVSELPCELIIYLPDVLENYFGEDNEALYQGVELQFEFGRSRGSDVLNRRMALRTHNLL